MTVPTAGRTHRAGFAALVCVLSLVGALAPAAAMPAPMPPIVDTEDDGPSALQQVTPRSTPRYNQSVIETYEVATPHGTIRGDVVRPVVPAGVTVPVILTYTPYSALYGALAPTRASRASDATASFFVPRGYARAVFDVVGTYGSDGCTDFGGLGERETAAAVVEFLGTQPWSNGRVGMIGGSYDGTTAIAAAIEAPEHLVTVVPQVAIDRWYDYMYNDGVRMTLEDNPSGLADPPGDSPADYDAVYGVVPPPAMLGSDPQGWAALLADHARPCNRAEHQVRGYQNDPVYDGFWTERDYRSLVDRVEASVLLEGAWLDDNVKHWGTTRFFQALKARVFEEGEEAPAVHMVIGQWSHSTSKFPDASKVRHAWFDHFLLGLDTNIDHLPVVDTEGSDGVRRRHDTWPPAGTEDVVHALASADAPESPTTLRLTSAEGTWTDANPLMVEQVITEQQCAETCIRLLGAPLPSAARIVGSPRLEVSVTTDAAETHLTPVLYEVTATGARKPITRGLLNARNRNGLAHSTPLVPGEAWTATVELWDIDHTLVAGSRLELVLASTNATWGLADEVRATSTVDLAQSRLTLPLVALG